MSWHDWRVEDPIADKQCVVKIVFVLDPNNCNMDVEFSGEGRWSPYHNDWIGDDQKPLIGSLLSREFAESYSLKIRILWAYSFQEE